MKYWIKYKDSDKTILAKSMADDLSAGAGETIVITYYPQVYYSPDEDYIFDAAETTSFKHVNELKKGN